MISNRQDNQVAPTHKKADGQHDQGRRNRDQPGASFPCCGGCTSEWSLYLGLSRFGSKEFAFDVEHQSTPLPLQALTGQV